MAVKAAVVLATLALTFGSTATAGAQAPSGGDQAEVSVIVVLDAERPSPAAAEPMATRHGGRAPLVFANVVNGFEFVGPAAAVDGLAHEPGVAAVVADETFSLTDSAGFGFFRIDAELSVSDPSGPYRGAGARVALIDSGVDTDHPDLAPNLDLAHGYNCINPGSAPEDDLGHGTHVAGIAAAAFNADGSGIVGVAPSASIVPFKAFDATGNGTTAQIVCALDHLKALTEAVPMPTALNMSFGDPGSDSNCDDGIVTDVLHEAICDVVSAGTAHGVTVLPVAAAGNDDADSAGTIPAAFHDVITVSALADHDGNRGGTAGCQYVSSIFNYECDDTIASFSNWGAAVDVMAPGVDIYSDSLNGGFELMSGTSMAAPHVTGVAALVLAEDPSLSFAAARALLVQTGECPDGTQAGADTSCSGQGTWQQTANRTIFDPVHTEADPDGIAEPVVNADRAALAADAGGNPPPVDTAPTVSITSPSPGSTVSGSAATVSGTSGDDHGVTQVQVLVDGTSIGTTTPGAGGAWSLPWNTTTASNGSHSLVARATDTVGHTTNSSPVSVTVSNAAPTPVLHVGELLGSATAGRKWTATATVRVVDGSGAPVSGATVQVSVASTAALAAAGGKPPPGGSGALSCVTGTDGRCSVSTKPSTTAVRFTVTGVTKSGWTYDATKNVDADTSTSQTDVVVRKP